MRNEKNNMNTIIEQLEKNTNEPEKHIIFCGCNFTFNKLNKRRMKIINRWKRKMKQKMMKKMMKSVKIN